MSLLERAELMRIFIGEADRHGHMPLYEALVKEARKQGMAGATVVQGIMGFGAESHMHTAKVLRLSENLPVIVEIVDTPEKIASFLATVETMMDGLITIERASVKVYRADRSTSHDQPN